MTPPDATGEPTPAKKLTRWLTNSPCLDEKLEKQCPGTHRHEPLVGGRPKAAQLYPPNLCAAIVAEFAEQLRLDVGSAADSVSAAPSRPSTSPVFNLEILQVDSEDTGSQLEINAAEVDDSQWIAEDDVHGGSLPASLVHAPRQKEIKYPKVGRCIHILQTPKRGAALGRSP